MVPRSLPKGNAPKEACEMATTTLADVLNRVQGVKKSGNEYKALCPAHDDKNPSLSITEKNGKVLLYCHAGPCRTWRAGSERATAAVAASRSRPPPSGASSAEGKPSKASSRAARAWPVTPVARSLACALRAIRILTRGNGYVHSIAGRRTNTREAVPRQAAPRFRLAVATGNW